VASAEAMMMPGVPRMASARNEEAYAEAAAAGGKGPMRLAETGKH